MRRPKATSRPACIPTVPAALQRRESPMPRPPTAGPCPAPRGRARRTMAAVAAAATDAAVGLAPGVHWIGALDPDLRHFDLILRTANGTTYNAYAVRGREGVAIVDTVK